MLVLNETIEAVTKVGFMSDLAEADAILPLCILDELKGLHPSLSPSLTQVTEFLSGLRGKSWKNPEIYLPMANLHRPLSADGADSQIRILETHLGIRNPAEFVTHGRRFYRLGCSLGVVVEVTEHGIETLLPSPWCSLRKDRYGVYAPRTGLFADFVSPALYPTVHAGADEKTFVEAITAALTVVADYSRFIANDLEDAVTAFIITPDYRDDQRWSFSFRLSYFHAIFLNPARRTPYELAEGILHEYLHQRLWQWWYFEPVSGLPDERIQVVSPVTGRNRSVAVMLQALMIYIQLNDFYLWLEAATTGAPLSSVRARRHELGASVPVLHNALLQHASRGSEFHRILDFLCETFIEGDQRKHFNECQNASAR